MARLETSPQFIPSPASIEIHGETTNLKLIRRAERGMKVSPSNPFRINKHYFYIKDLGLSFRASKLIEANFDMILTNPSKYERAGMIYNLQKDLEKSFNYVKISIDRPIINLKSFQTHYIKHDFKKVYPLIGDMFIVAYDIIPKDGNCWKIDIILKKEEYCPDCNDEHTVTTNLKEILFKNKSSFFGTIGGMISNKVKTYNRYINETKDN